MTKTVRLHVGDTLDRIGERVIDAWHRAERGELTAQNAEIHIGFDSLETMVRTLSPKRLQLLRHVHRHPAENVGALAQAVGRYRRGVEADVDALESAGLLERDGDGARADYDAFEVQMRVAL